VCSEERERKYEAFDPADLAESVREKWMTGKSMFLCNCHLSVLLLNSRFSSMEACIGLTVTEMLQPLAFPQKTSKNNKMQSEAISVV